MRYDRSMATTGEYHILDRMLNPVGQCLTRDVAALIVALRADPGMQRRLDELAEKNAESRLTSQEQEEYDAYVEALDVVAIFQTKAHKALKAAKRSK